MAPSTLNGDEKEPEITQWKNYLLNEILQTKKLEEMFNFDLEHPDCSFRVGQETIIESSPTKLTENLAYVQEMLKRIYFGLIIKSAVKGRPYGVSVCVVDDYQLYFNFRVKMDAEQISFAFIQFLTSLLKANSASKMERIVNYFYF